ncbi:MAG: LysR family transcriptional regulator [Oscillospiraceae bacterium]
METRYLEQLIMIEKSRSMRDAAEELFLSQSALSHNLKKLETELGCQLFDRTRNQLTLNTYGNIMLVHSKRIVEELEAVKREIAEEKIRLAQKVSVGIYAYAFESFVMPNLANAIEGNVFECHIHDSVRLREGLSEGTLDVIFTDCPAESDEFVAARLFKEQIMVSLPSSSEYASRQSIFISDLAKLNLYLVSDASGYTPWFERVLTTAGIGNPLANAVPFREYLYKKDSIDRCHLTSSFIIRFLPTTARRVLVPLAEEIGTRDIYMIYKRQAEDRLRPLLAYIEKYQDRLFTGSAFLPYFLFPGEQSNLLFCNDSE